MEELCGYWKGLGAKGLHRVLGGFWGSLGAKGLHKVLGE